MRLIIGKVLLLTVVIGLGCGIAYLTFKRMPADGPTTTTTSDQLAKAVQLAESNSSTTAQPDYADYAATGTDDSQSPFALTEPSDEDALPPVAEKATGIPPAESLMAFQFELPETATAVTPVSFTTESTDDSEDTDEQPDDTTNLAPPQSQQPVEPDSSSDEAAVMFFGAGATDTAADSGSQAPTASDSRSSGGFTLLPSVAPGPPATSAAAQATGTTPANPRRSAPAPLSASRAARESAKASSGKSAPTRSSDDIPGPATRTPAATTASNAVTPAVRTPVSPEPLQVKNNRPDAAPAPVTRSRPQPQPRTPQAPAGNLFFAGNSSAKSPPANSTAAKPVKPEAGTASATAAAAAVTPTPSTTRQPADAGLSRPSPAPAPAGAKDPLLSQTTRSSKPPAFPATASLDEPSVRTPRVKPEAEPEFPSLNEPPMEDEENSATAATSSTDDAPFMRELDPPTTAESSPPDKPAAAATFNPFEPVDTPVAPLPSNQPEQPNQPPEVFEPQFEPLLEPAEDAEPTLTRPGTENPPAPRSTPEMPEADQPELPPARSSMPPVSSPPVTAPPLDVTTPEVLFPELTVPEPVPSFPADQETARPPVNPPARLSPAPTTKPTPTPTPTPNPGPFASDAGRTRVTPPAAAGLSPESPAPAPATSPARGNSPPTARPRTTDTSDTSAPFAPTPSAEMPFEPEMPSAPAIASPPMRRMQPESADLPAVPFPAEPRPFPSAPATPPVTSGRSVESLQPLPERTGVPGDVESRTVIQPERSRRAGEPFPIERGGTAERIRSNPALSPAASAEPEPFPMNDEPGGLDESLETQPLPPFEELPSRSGGAMAPSISERTNRPESGRASGGTPVKAVEKLRPQLTIEKKAPESATIGIAHEYRILVANDGDTAARDVVVEDELNGAAEFLSSNPPADYDPRSGAILWTFEELAPRESREIVVRVKPTGEGMLTGTATVRFRTEVRSATLIRAPKLQLEIDGPEQVLVGEDVRLRFTIRNAGSGDAAGVLLRSVLPDAIRHPEGADLEYEIELLRAGDEQSVDLTAVAAEPGRPVRISAEISASGIAPVIARNNLTVIGSQLTVERLGPARRFVGRPAKFQNVVVNETDFEAVDAVITEDVPDGMRVLAVGSGGEYNPKNRRITWQLPRIRAGEQTVLEVELQPETTGRMESIVEVVEKAGFRSRAEENTTVEVEGLHNVTADISRQDQPVAVGERFGFTVAVDNRGTAVARNVELTIQVPAGLQVLAAGTREIEGRLLPGNIVRYSIVQSLKPGEQLPFQVTLQGREAVRNAVIQARLKYDEMSQPLIVSESVTVFDDQP